MSNSIYRSEEGATAVAEKYRELLKQWPVAKDELDINTQFGKTFVIGCGHPQNPPLILLHGMGINSLMWINDIASFTKSHRVYAIDIPGEPGFSEANRFDLKSDAPEQWLDEILSALGLGQTAIIGISFGGFLGLRYATRNPERVTKLALMCPAGVSPVKKSFFAGFVWRALFLGPYARKSLLKVIQGKDHVPNRVASMMATTGKWFKPRNGGIPIIKLQALKQLYCPILLILGGKDPLFNSDKTLLRLAKATPQLEVIYREESGHLLSECTRELDRFLVTLFAPD